MNCICHWQVSYHDVRPDSLCEQQSTSSELCPLNEFSGWHFDCTLGRKSQSPFTQDFRGEPLGHKLSWRLFFHLSSALIPLLLKPQYILFSRTGVWPIESVQVGKVSCTDEIRTSDLHVRTLRHYPLDHGCPKCVFVFVNKWISKINVTR